MGPEGGGAVAVSVKVAGTEGADASFLSKAGPLVLARLITAFLTLSIPLVLARMLPPDQYGTYKQLFLISQTIAYVLPFGMAQALYFFIPRSTERRPYFVHTLGFLALGGLLAAAGVYALGTPLSRYATNPAILDYRGSLALYTMLTMAACALEIGLTSQGKTKVSAVIYLVTDTTRATVMVLPVLLGHGLTGVMHALVGFAAVRLVVCWVMLLRGTHGPFFSKELLRAQLKYAWPFGAAMFLAIPQQYAHQYAVMGYVTPALFAIYSIGCFQLPIVDLLYTPTSEVLMVRMGELETAGRMHEALDAFRVATSKLSLVFFPMAAFLFAAAPEFIAALFGPRFAAAVPIFRISVSGILLATLPVDGVLRASNQTRHIFISYLVKTLATIPLVYFGVTRFGMMGGICSWAAAEYLGKAVLIARVPHALSTPAHRVAMSELLPWRHLSKALTAAVASALFVVIIRNASAFAWIGLPTGFVYRLIPLAAAGILFVIAYIGVLWMTGVRPNAVLQSIRRERVQASG